MLGDTVIDWKSSTQQYMTSATCEAEYVALCDASKKALFIRAVLVYHYRFSLYGEYVVCSFLLDGVFLVCDHGLDF